MVHVDLVAVLFRKELRRHPFASIDAQCGAPNGLSILAPAHALIVAVLALHPVVATIVRNLEDLIKESVSLRLACAGVLLRKSLVLGEPQENRGSGWCAFFHADRSQTFTGGDAVADQRLERCDLFRRIGHVTYGREWQRRSSCRLPSALRCRG